MVAGVHDPRSLGIHQYVDRLSTAITALGHPYRSAPRPERGEGCHFHLGNSTRSVVLLAARQRRLPRHGPRRRPPHPGAAPAAPRGDRTAQRPPGRTRRRPFPARGRSAPRLRRPRRGPDRDHPLPRRASGARRSRFRPPAPRARPGRSTAVRAHGRVERGETRPGDTLCERAANRRRPCATAACRAVTNDALPGEATRAGAILLRNPPPGDYEQAILAADAAICVRGDSVGETNAPLLEAIGAGRPSLVTDVGSAPKVAGASARVVSPSVRGIRAGLSALLDDDERRQRAASARARAAELTWEQAARRHVELLEELRLA